jgi:hypothetical protein
LGVEVNFKVDPSSGDERLAEIMVIIRRYVHVSGYGIMGNRLYAPLPPGFEATSGVQSLQQELIALPYVVSLGVEAI